MSAVTEAPRQLWVSSEKVAGTPGGSGQERIQTEGTHVLVSLADSGSGLNPSALDHLFDASYTTKPQGLGMGLAINVN